MQSPRPLRIARALSAVIVVMSAMTAGAAEQNLPADPRLRLQALQHALVNAAMAGQTRVRSAAWIDSSGQLHETTRITSDMKVRGVRVLSYLQDESSPSAAIVADANSVTRSDEACRANQQKYRREATLETALRIAATGAERHDWTLLLQQAKARLHAQSAVERKWLFTAHVRMPDTQYERMLTGAQPDQSPYQMLLELLPSGAMGIEPVRPEKTREQKAASLLKNARDYLSDEAPRRASIPFVMRLSVTERSSQRLMWQGAVPLFFPESEIRTTSQPLPASLAIELDLVMKNWQDQLDANFGCRPLQFNVVEQGVNGWTINGGQAAGLSVGDQLLLLNREQVPARILEPDSAQHMALVEVVSVRSGLATIRKLAGPSDLPKGADWVATPF